MSAPSLPAHAHRPLAASGLRHLARHAAPCALAALLVGGLTGRVTTAEPLPMSAEEYKLYKEYTLALGDERVQKIPENKRVAAIAKNFKVKEKDLLAAIEKGEKHASGAGAACEARIRALAEEAGVAARISEVRVDDSEPHVVAYVNWTNADGTKLEEEASLMALLASQGAPIASTVALWATDQASGQRVFQAKISATAASKFVKERISMFAATRYIRLFEDVRNAYKGTPPDQPN